MEKLRNRKLEFLFIFVSIIALILGVHNVFLYKHINELKKDTVQNLTTEYNEIYNLCKTIDQYYIKMISEKLVNIDYWSIKQLTMFQLSYQKT